MGCSGPVSGSGGGRGKLCHGTPITLTDMPAHTQGRGSCLQRRHQRLRGSGISGPAMPSFMRERLAELQQEGLGLDSSDSDEQDSDGEGGEDGVNSGGLPRRLSETHSVLTVTVIKMGKLGMRISETDNPTERGFAYIEDVSDGPAKAAGVCEGDLILTVGGVPVKGRAQATAKITSANGLLTLELARRKTRMPRGGAGGAPGGSTVPVRAGTVPAYGYQGVD